MDLIPVVITKVYKSDKKKSGEKLIDKNGKPYQKIAIKTDVHGDQYLSNFIFRQDDPQNNFQVGDRVEILVERNGQYLNYKIPNKSDLLEYRVEKLERAVFYDQKDSRINDVEHDISKDITEEDLPF